MRTTRRSFVRMGLGVGTIAAVAPALGITLNAPTSNLAYSPQRIVYDDRFAAACEFAQESQRLGVITLGITGSVHDVWERELSPLWRQGPVSVAGMTDFRALFLLEMMASDAKLRVVHRIHHIENPDGATVHRLFGPVGMRAQWQSRLDKSGAGWPRQSAAISTRWQDRPQSSGSKGSDIAAARDHGIDRNTLVSWVIAAPRAGLIVAPSQCSYNLSFLTLNTSQP